jgi:predicted dehydrogenase
MQVWSGDGCVQIDFAAREAAVYRPTPTLLFGTPPVDRARQPGANIDQLKADVFGTLIEVQKPLAVPRDQLTEELLAFVESVRTREPPEVSGEQGLTAVETAEAILDSIARHQWDATAHGRVGPLLATGMPRQKMAG